MYILYNEAIMDIDSLMDDMNGCAISEESNHSTNTMVSHIRSLNIENILKRQLIALIQNDNINSYLEIYEICLENDIQLPSF